MNDELKRQMQVPMLTKEWEAVYEHMKRHNYILGRWTADAIREKLAREQAMVRDRVEGKGA